MSEQRQESKLSDEFEVIVGMHHVSVLSPFVFALVVDVVTVFAREGMLSELLHADDLVLMSETIERCWNKFLKWKEDFESKRLKNNLGKTKVMVSGSITKDGLSRSKIDSFGVCSLSVEANSVLCIQCGKWILGRCAGVNRVSTMFSGNFTCRKCGGNIGVAVKQEETSCDDVQTVSEFTYLGDRVTAGGGCEAALTARKRCGWAKFYVESNVWSTVQR